MSIRAGESQKFQCEFLPIGRLASWPNRVERCESLLLPNVSDGSIACCVRNNVGW